MQYTGRSHNKDWVSNQSNLITQNGALNWVRKFLKYAFQLRFFMGGVVDEATGVV
jgi:hypothetical protein